MSPAFWSGVASTINPLGVCLFLVAGLLTGALTTVLLQRKYPGSSMDVMVWCYLLVNIQVFQLLRFASEVVNDPRGFQYQEGAHSGITVMVFAFVGMKFVARWLYQRLGLPQSHLKSVE